MLYLTRNKAWDLVEDYNLDKILYLLIDRPDYINENCEMIWHVGLGSDYREYDLPAAVQEQQIFESYNIWWYNIKSQIHREHNKPAVLWYDDEKAYYINGELIKSEKD